MTLSVLKDIRKIYAGLNADEIRAAAGREVNAGLMAGAEQDYAAMEEFLAPAWLDEQSRRRALRAIHRVDGQADAFDFILCGPGTPVPRKGFLFDPGNTDALPDVIAGELQPIELSLGRTFPVFRKPVAGRIVNRVSRENAFVAIMTALPDVIPSLVELPWAIAEFATDTAFISMNQIRLALMMAALHDKTVGYMEQKAQIGVIAAGAFGWRAIARELVGKIPMGGGLIPKAAIAFAGTWVVGLGLQKVNQTGSGFSRQERRDAYADAFARGREIVRDLIPAGLVRR